MSVLANGTSPIAYTAPGVVENFAYRDGALVSVSPDWVDAYDVWGPTMFDQATVATGQLDATGYTASTYGTTTPTRWVGHTLLSRPMGQSDNAEVIVEWMCPDEWSVISQVSPVAFVDMSAAYNRMGVLPIFDVSVFGGVTYLQAAFRSTLADVFNPTYYALDQFPNSGVSLPYGDITTGAGVSHWWRMRCVNNHMSCWLDDFKIVDNYAVPSWAQGRDGWGLHIIPIHFDIGASIPPFNTPTLISPTLVGRWMWRPYTGPL